MTEDLPLVQLAGSYRSLILDWEQASDAPKKANKIFKKRQTLYKRLRESDAGRQAIVQLVYDRLPCVRLIAATDALAWAPEESIPILEQLATDDGIYGLDARYTLREYRAGRLDLSW
jgi:hypothetical protein